ncbi:MAG: diaminopimelate decarboxylase [Deltaproteobacteria bacterium]|nr:diaminopimelate decarboxylase [Deltaproteobacteria bacterium]
MKAKYEPPLIVRHSLAGVNKLGSIPAIRPMSSIDGVRIEELVVAYGSPLFVFSENTLRERVRELRGELGRRFASFDLGWSYKTNYLSAVCRVFHQEGSLAEVVSGMELRKALAAGVAGQQIIFNGPAKTAADLTLAFEKRVQVHIDHLDELALAETVAEGLGIVPEVGIRVSQSDLPVPTWDRFGFHLESGRAIEAARRIVRSGRLGLRSLHGHIGTFIPNPDAYRMAALAMTRFARQIESELGARITTIDLGGGFASHNTLHAQYLPGEEATPSFSEYVEAIASGLEEGLDGAETPRLVLETGRALVDDAGVLVATVLGNKRLADKRRAVIVDAGVNILPTAWWYRHDVRPAQEILGTAEPTVFFGPLCMAIDVVRDRVMFPPLRVGDRVVIRHVGAYNVTQWMQFISERPNVVMVSPKGQHAIIRKAETLETLLLQEQMPAWL